MPTVRFVWVDVFAETALTGNPLALVPDADEIPDDVMRAIAREFNQSETTFIVRPSAAGADHRLRSFTPGGMEVLGAGHNAMGAWIWLADEGGLAQDRDDFVQQIGDDVLPVRVDRHSGDRARVTMVQSPPRFLHATREHGRLADALRLDLDDLDIDRAAEVVSTGAEHLLVAAASRAAVDSANPDSAQLKRFLADNGAEGCYLYATEPNADGIDAYTRFFNPTVGIAEDPATGTAAGPLAALLVRDGTAVRRHPVLIEQGTALGRRSVLEARVDGPVVELSGSGLVVADGRLRV